MPHYRLRIHCGQLVEPDLNLECTELSQRNASEMLNEVMVDLAAVNSAVRRAPCTLAHRKIPLSNKPPKCYGIILEGTGHLRRHSGFLEDERVQHLLCLPLCRACFWAEGNVASLPDLLSRFVTEVHGVLAVPHLHLLPSRVDGALLILQCHGCSPLAWLPSLIVENTSFIHEIARAGKTVAYPVQPERLPRRPICTA